LTYNILSSRTQNLHRKKIGCLPATLKSLQTVSRNFPKTCKIRYNSTTLLTTIHSMYIITINTVKFEFSSPNLDSSHKIDNPSVSSLIRNVSFYFSKHQLSLTFTTHNKRSIILPPQLSWNVVQNSPSLSISP